MSFLLFSTIEAYADVKVAAGGTAAAGYMAKGLTLTKGALIKNTGTIAKICTSSFHCFDARGDEDG